MLHYIGLIVLVFVALVLGVPLLAWCFSKCWAQRKI
jgi:hypothetical protein